MSLQLGGKQRGLKFNIGTLNCLRKQYDVDPLNWKSEGGTWDNVFPYGVKILHAALLSNCASKKEEPDFTKEDVEEWANDLSAGELTEVIVSYNNIFSTSKEKANGEVSKDDTFHVGATV